MNKKIKLTLTHKISALKTNILLVLFLVFLNTGFGQELTQVESLKGNWKFSIGDNKAWADTYYNDSNWEEIYVPRSWEDQGFHGYDGYAWYRKTFTVDVISEKASYYLQLGYIDDVDEVYLNGKLIGRTGHFLPEYSTAYNAKRLYMIPHKYLHKDKSFTIAVRVYDEGGEGGITHGELGFYIDNESIFPDYDLSGIWKFKTGGCGNVLETETDISSWDEILVPGPWEDQGYKNYDGLACYITDFELGDQFNDHRMVLLMGRIDDLDMVYVNGVLIGQSGAFEIETAEQRHDMYKVNRGYYIPKGILKSNGTNRIVVKVLDWWGLGGIWDGNIGLITQDNYIKYWQKKRNSIH